MSKKTATKKGVKPANSLDITRDDIIDETKRIVKDFNIENLTFKKWEKHSEYSERQYRKHFDSFNELKTACGFAVGREVKRVRREKINAAEAEWLQEYASVQLLPYHNKYWKERNPKRKTKIVITASDFHDIESNPFALRIFLDTCFLMQPDDICLNGDVADMLGLSHFPYDTRRVQWKKRKLWLHNLLTTLRKICPNSNIIYIIGNHEARFFKYHADKETIPYLSDYAELTVNQIYGIAKYEIDFICKLDLGAFANSEIRHQLNQNSKVLYDCYLMTHEPPAKDKEKAIHMSGTNGHHHINQLEAFNIFEPGGAPEGEGTIKEYTWVQTGAMSYKDAKYLKNPRGPWQNGFAIAHIDTRFNEVVQYPVHINQNMACVNGKEYHARKNELRGPENNPY